MQGVRWRILFMQLRAKQAFSDLPGGWLRFCVPSTRRPTLNPSSGQGARILHVAKKVPRAAMKSPRAATKTWCSQIKAKQTKLSTSQFLHLQNGGDSCACFIELGFCGGSGGDSVRKWMYVIHVSKPQQWWLLLWPASPGAYSCMLHCSHSRSLNSFSVKQEDEQPMMNIKCLVKEGEKVLSFCSWPGPLPSPPPLIPHPFPWRLLIDSWHPKGPNSKF